MPKILRYWLSILKRGFKEAAQFVALHKFWIALAPATLAPLYLWRVFGIHSVTNLWKIALSAAMGYGTAFGFTLLWKLFSVPATLDQEKSEALNDQRKSAKDRESEQVKALQNRVLELEEAARIDVELQKVNLSLSLKTEDTPKAILMGTGQDSSGQPFQVHVTEMTLLIYNHGEKPVVLRGCKLWKLHATQQTREISLHGVATSATPVYVDVTEPLVRTISDNPTLNFVSLQGKYTVRIMVMHCQGATTISAQPRDFQITCKPWRGSGTLRIEASEIPTEQS